LTSRSSNCASTSFHSGVPSSLSSSLVPYSARLFSTSLSDRPCAASTLSVASTCEARASAAVSQPVYRARYPGAGACLVGREGPGSRRHARSLLPRRAGAVTFNTAGEDRGGEAGNQFRPRGIFKARRQRCIFRGQRCSALWACVALAARGLGQRRRLWPRRGVVRAVAAREGLRAERAVGALA